MKPGDTYILESKHVLTATGPQVHKASGPCAVSRPWRATQPTDPERALRPRPALGTAGPPGVAHSRTRRCPQVVLQGGGPGLPGGVLLA